MPGYRLRTSEEGGSMVETALLSLLMVPIIVYANFFFDFSFANLKALEASRYAAWELTAVRLSDWVGENHSNFFTTESGIIINEVESRWGDDMNSATEPGGLAGSSQTCPAPCLYDGKYSGLSVATLSQTQNMIIDIKNEPYEFLGTAPSSTSSETGIGVLWNILQGVLSIFSNVVDWVFNHFGFNTNGFVETKVQFSLDFDRKVPIFKGASMLPDTLFTTHPNSVQKILVDAWDVKDGSSVDEGQNHRLKIQTSSGSYEPREYFEQVKRMYLWGVPDAVGDLFSFMSWFPITINDIFSFFGIHNPFYPVVRSYRLEGDNSGSSGTSCDEAANKSQACIHYDDGPNTSVYLNSATSSDNVADPDGANSRRKFYTNVYKDMNDKTKSPYYKVYSRQGNYYMGCKLAQQKKCEYQ